MKVNRQYFLTEIDKQAQAKAKEVLPGIKVADTMALMKYYLQHGHILQIGDLAKESFPEAEVGDTLIFRHTVEDDDWREIYKDDKVSHRLVENDNYDIMGIQKPDGTIIPQKKHLFCKSIAASGKWELKNGLYTFHGADFDTAEDFRAKLDKLDDEVKFLAESSGNVGPKIEQIKKEQMMITKMLNKRKIKKVELLYIHPETRQEFDNIQDHDIIVFEGWIDYDGYPLQFKGVEYLIIKKDIVVGRHVPNQESITVMKKTFQNQT